ncbi:hypothetical protein ACA910_018954 [Epithemia clementina (nom. ined.)]
MELLIQSNELKFGTEVFVFADNATAKSAFYKGISKSKFLFNLVLRLCKMEMDGQLFVHIIWIAGTRMIEQGTDGLSRGDLMHGVLAGANMLDFIPLNRSISTRHPDLALFLAEPMLDFFPPTFLNPDGWYSTAFEPGNYVWTPPPAAAVEGLEQLCDCKHVSPPECTLVCVPGTDDKSMAKKLGRIADMVFTVPVGSFAWPSFHHEPVIVGLIFSFLELQAMASQARQEQSG